MNALTGLNGLLNQNGLLAQPRLRRRPLVVGLLNNMPDAALEATRRQWSRLITDPGHDQGEVVLRCYALPEIARGALAAQEIRQTYCSLASLRTDPPDALIVSGAAPVAQRLEEERFWPALTEILDWAQARGMGLILSCLSAHAAVLHEAGITRVCRTTKCSGVFRQDIRSEHAFLWGMERGLVTPHSRWNDLPETALTDAGYRVLTASAEAGVDIFTHASRDAVLYLNGHPEYEADTLLREYRRDVTRYVTGQCAEYPELPLNAFGAEAEAVFRAFRVRAEADRRQLTLNDFPRPPVALDAPWTEQARSLIGNWLWHVRARVRHPHAA